MPGKTADLFRNYFDNFFSDFREVPQREELLKRARTGNLLFFLASVSMWLVCVVMNLLGYLQYLGIINSMMAFLLSVTVLYHYVLYFMPRHFIWGGFLIRFLHYGGIIAFVYVTGGINSPFLFIPVVHAFTDMFVVHLLYGLFSLILGVLFSSTLLTLEVFQLLPDISIIIQDPSNENFIDELLRYSVLMVTLFLGAAGIVYTSFRIRVQEKALKIANEKLRDYYHSLNLLEIQREREQIAQELHDNLGNDLTHIKLMSELSLSSFQKNPEKSRQLLEEIRESSRENIETLRTFLWVIYPRENTWENFFNYLQTMAERQLHPFGIKLFYEIQEGSRLAPRDSLMRFKLLRIVKEALSNIIKHAQATEVSLSIRQTEDGLHLTVRDNGKGFDSAKAREGYGIRFMAKRIEEVRGSFDLSSELGEGTRLEIYLPLQKETVQ